MFVGHYGPAFAAKAASRSIPLWFLFVAVLLAPRQLSWHEPAHCVSDFVTQVDPLPHVICYPPDWPAGAVRDEASQHGYTQGIDRGCRGPVS